MSGEEKSKILEGMQEQMTICETNNILRRAQTEDLIQ